MNTSALVKLYNFSIHTVLNRWVSPYVVMFFIHFFPSGVNLYSVLTILYSGSGILNKHKIDKKIDFIDEFDVQESGLNKFEEINVIMRGESVDLFQNDINYSIPTFCVSFNEDDKTNLDVIYITADNGQFYRMKNNNLTPQILIGNGDIGSNSYNLELDKRDVFNKTQPFSLIVNYSGYKAYTPGSLNKSTGSGVLSIVALSKIAKKINIYGWDFYMNDFVYKKSYFKLLLYFAKAIESRKSILGYTFYKIINFNYMYRVSQDRRFHVFSFFTNLQKHKKLFLKLEKIIYKKV